MQGRRPDHWRRHSILALLSAVAIVRSFFFAANKIEESLGSRRQLARQLAAKRAGLSRFADPKSVVPRAAAAPGRPNVVYVLHESLSGRVLLHTAAGADAAPHFTARRRDDPEFYVLEHHRAASGNTIDALPALLTGCLPFAKKGVGWVQTKGRGLGHAFAAAGYRTAGFSSRALDYTMKRGQWKMLYDLLAGGLDRVVDPFENPAMTQDNGQGSSDGQILPMFEGWLAELEGKGEGDPSTPFYAQFYNFNQHYPYLNETGEAGPDYYSSLHQTDLFLERLFDVLSRTGHLENTVVVGSSDHGEDPFRGPYARLLAWNTNVLHGAAYVHYPGRLLAPGAKRRLRRNAGRLTSTLDLHPTLLGLLRSGDGRQPDGPLADPRAAATAGCVTGVDLAAADVPDDRVVLSLNLASPPAGRTLWALSTRDAALYRLWAPTGYKPFGQGRHNQYVLLFGDCARATAAWCTAEVDAGWQEYFRRAIVALRRGSGFMGEEVLGSEILQFFVNAVGGVSAVEATEKAMLAG